MRKPLWLVVALGLGFSPPAQNSDDAKRFVGSWRLVSIDSDGERNPMWGPKPIGVIYYDASGNMAVQIMPDRERPSWKQNESPSPEQAVVALSGYVAYFGTYTVDEKARTVSHHRMGTINASGVGVDLVRRYEFASGDRLILTPVDNPSVHLTWEREK
jgi:hypothetical protein